MSAAEEAEYCSGPKLMAWLKEVEPGLWADRNEGGTGAVKSTLGDSWNRRFYDWNRGSQASVYTVDRLMVSLGRHLLEIPEDVWEYENAKKPSVRRMDRERARALDMLSEGYLPTEVAKEIGVATRSVTRWAQKARVAEHWGKVAA